MTQRQSNSSDGARSSKKDQWIADTAYISNGAITLIKRRPDQEQPAWQRQFNRMIAALRSPVEHAIARLKNWKILSTGHRGPLNHLPNIIRAVSKLELYRLWNQT